jgi:hypothetical protein
MSALHNSIPANSFHPNPSAKLKKPPNMPPQPPTNPPEENQPKTSHDERLPTAQAAEATTAVAEQQPKPKPHRGSTIAHLCTNAMDSFIKSLSSAL